MEPAEEDPANPTMSSINPLDIPSITDLVLENLGFEDWKRCRGVNSSWNQLSAKYMRNVSKVEINNLTHWCGESQKYLENENSSFLEHPFATEFVVKGPSVSCFANTSFWKFASPQIRVLKLQNLTFESAGDFRKVIFGLCENLEILTLQSVRMTREPLAQSDLTEKRPYKPATNLKRLVLSDMRDFDNYWLDFLAGFSAVQDLRLGKLNSASNKILKSLCQLRERDKSMWKLKTLQFRFHESLENSTLTGFFAIEGLQLENLKITKVSRKRFDTVRTLLGSQSSSLEKVAISCARAPSFPLLPLPNEQTMPALREFHCDFRPSSSLTFLNTTPRIETLTLSTHLGNWDPPTQVIIAPACRKLTINSLCTSQNLSALFTCLPNLEQLKLLTANFRIFQTIASELPNLKSLCMETCNLLDNDFTGFDNCDVVRINREGPKGNYSPITVRRPNLTSLSNLEVLEIRDSSYMLNYATMAFGVNALPRLRKFSVEPVAKVNHAIWKDVLRRLA